MKKQKHGAPNGQTPFVNPGISRRDFMGLLSIGAISLSLGTFNGCSADDNRPNIIFILTDDQRHDAMGCAGNTQLETENMDRLASEGVRFSNAFVTTSLCSPSRASFLTGCYAHTHGVLGNETVDPNPTLPSFPGLLQNSGYETAFIGKWHLLKDATPRPGFDHWVSFVGQGNYYRNTLNVNGTWELSMNYVTDELTTRALDFLEQKHKNPFLLYISHKAAHGPFKPAVRHQNKYLGVPFRSQHHNADILSNKPDWGGRNKNGQTEKTIGNYHRCLLAVDDSIGLILDSLDKQGLTDNTVVIFAGDNGYMFGEHGGLTDKRAAYESSIRIPMLMRYPKLIEPGSTCDAMVLNIDLAPTLLELGGVTIPSGMEGRSWLTTLHGTPGRDAFLYEYFHDEGPVPTIVGVRTRQWKYVTYPLDANLTEELYNLEQDPQELNNRINEPGDKEQVLVLRQTLEELKAQTGYHLPKGPIQRN